MGVGETGAGEMAPIHDLLASSVINQCLLMCGHQPSRETGAMTVYASVLITNCTEGINMNTQHYTTGVMY